MIEFKKTNFIVIKSELLSNNHKNFWLIKSKDLIWEKKPKKFY